MTKSQQNISKAIYKKINVGEKSFSLYGVTITRDKNYKRDPVFCLNSYRGKVHYTPTEIDTVKKVANKLAKIITSITR